MINLPHFKTVHGNNDGGKNNMYNALHCAQHCLNVLQIITHLTLTTYDTGIVISLHLIDNEMKAYRV